jgi:hypothetical protein
LVDSLSSRFTWCIRNFSAFEGFYVSWCFFPRSLLNCFDTASWLGFIISLWSRDLNKWSVLTSRWQFRSLSCCEAIFQRQAGRGKILRDTSGV